LRAGTESRKLLKLSFMWSRRFLSNALWCARFSAYKKVYSLVKISLNVTKTIFLVEVLLLKQVSKERNRFCFRRIQNTGF
jgi:hypothetical protein